MNRAPLWTVIVALSALAIAGCGSGGGPLTIAITAPGSLAASTTGNLSATVTHDPKAQGVTWSCAPVGFCGTFTLAHTVAVDTPVSPGLSKKLILTISDLGDPTCVTGCPAAAQLYTGTMFAMPATIALGTYAPGATHRYQFVVSFPDGGTGGADNAYQGASTTVDYDWSSTS